MFARIFLSLLVLVSLLFSWAVFSSIRSPQGTETQYRVQSVGTIGILNPRQRATVERISQGLDRKIHQMIELGKQTGFGFKDAFLYIWISGKPRENDLWLGIVLVFGNPELVEPGSAEIYFLERYWLECPKANSPLIKEVINELVKEIVSEIIILDRSRRHRPKIFRPRILHLTNDAEPKAWRLFYFSVKLRI